LALYENNRRGWAGIYDLAFSPDSQLIATALSDRKVRIRRTTTGEPVHTLEGHSEAVRSVSFSPDGKLLASASNNEVIIWDVKTGREVRVIQCQSSPVAFSPDGRLIAVGGSAPGLLDAATGRLVLRFDGHRGPVYSLAFQPGSNCLVLGGWRGAVLLALPAADAILPRVKETD
jgi:WD40 repeat protein